MWKIQKIISRRSCHQSCQLVRADHAGWHADLPRSQTTEAELKSVAWGKIYHGSVDWPEFDCFIRQSAIDSLVRSRGLIRLTNATLESRLPVLIYPWLPSISLRLWLSAALYPDMMMRAVSILRSISETLAAIHQVGFVHGQVDPEHVLIDHRDQSVRLIGLGGIQPTGSLVRPLRWSTTYDAPERHCGEHEASSAADIYSLGRIALDLMGSSMNRSSIILAMMAENPMHRPSAAEMSVLFRDLEMRFMGEYIQPRATPARVQASYRAA